MFCWSIRKIHSNKQFVFRIKNTCNKYFVFGKVHCCKMFTVFLCHWTSISEQRICIPKLTALLLWKRRLMCNWLPLQKVEQKTKLTDIIYISGYSKELNILFSILSSGNQPPPHSYKRIARTWRRRTPKIWGSRVMTHSLTCSLHTQKVDTYFGVKEF